jgi:hypothetical protein
MPACVIDLDFDHLMDERGITSLAQQACGHPSFAARRGKVSFSLGWRRLLLFFVLAGRERLTAPMPSLDFADSTSPAARASAWAAKFQLSTGGREWQTVARNGLE